MANLPDLPDGASPSDLNDSVLAAARALAAALAKLPPAVRADSAEDLKAASDKASTAYDNLQDAVEMAAAAMELPTSQAALVGATTSIAVASGALLAASRASATDAEDAEAAAAVNTTNDAASEAVANLVATLESAAPGTQSEFDAIVSSIMAAVSENLGSGWEDGQSPDGGLDTVLAKVVKATAKVKKAPTGAPRRSRPGTR